MKRASLTVEIRGDTTGFEAAMRRTQRALREHIRDRRPWARAARRWRRWPWNADFDLAEVWWAWPWSCERDGHLCVQQFGEAEARCLHCSERCV